LRRGALLDNFVIRAKDRALLWARSLTALVLLG
jgi:hypothetical protein